MKKRVLTIIAALALIIAYTVPAGASSGTGTIDINAAAQDGILTVDVSATADTVYAEDRTETPADIVMVLDQSGSMKEKYDSSNTKQQALKKAASAFLDELGESDHRVSVVTFADNAKVTTDWTELSENGIAEIKEDINSLPAKPKGSTYMDEGLAKAGELISSRTETTYSLQDGSSEDRKVMVILFTDGYPGETSASGDYFSNYYDTPDEADDAVAEASKLKKMGAEVFTVGAFDGAKPYAAYKTTKKKIIWTVWRSAAKSANGLMHFISSDYSSKCTSWRSYTTTNDGRDNGYYQSASNTSQLSRAFRDIVDEYIAVDKEIKLGSDSEVKLVLTDEFKVSGDVTVTGGADVEVTGNEVTVTGYDYTANAGTKITVNIPFEADTEKYGSLYLLEDYSGVYSEGNILKYLPSVKYAVVDTFDIDSNMDDSDAMEAYFKKIFGSSSFYNNQWQAMKTVEQLEDNIYMMDYTYDYDIHDLMNTGVSSLTELLAYCSEHLLDGAFDFTYGDDPLGCSAVTSFNEEGDNMLGRNFDYKDAPCFVVWTHPDDAYASISLVDANFMVYGDYNTPTSTLNRFQTLLAPYVCVDGMNEKGLSIGVLQLDTDSTDQDTGKTDMTTTTMIRAALDTCASVDEAVELFGSYDMHDSMGVCFHYLICDSEKSVVLEYVDNDMRIIEPGDAEYDEYMEGYEGNPVSFAANFFLSEDGDHSEDHGNHDSDQGGNRAKVISDALKTSHGVMSEDELMDVLEGASMYYKHTKYPWYIKTLWSNVYNCNDGTLTMAARMNYDTTYTFSVTKPKQLLD